MFDSSSIPKPGQRLNLKNLQNNIKYMTRTRDDDKNLETLAREKYGLCEQNPEVRRIMRGWFKVMASSIRPRLHSKRTSA